MPLTFRCHRAIYLSLEQGLSEVLTMRKFNLAYFMRASVTAI
jgi:hypothetical protein